MLSFKLKMWQKPFGGRAPLRPSRGAYGTPTGPSRGRSINDWGRGPRERRGSGVGIRQGRIGKMRSEKDPWIRERRRQGRKEGEKGTLACLSLSSGYAPSSVLLYNCCN